MPNTFEIVKLFFEKVQGQTILDFGLAPHINPVACTIEESSSNFQYHLAQPKDLEQATCCSSDGYNLTLIAVST